MDAERSFRAFRKRRDPARLAEVFDLVAEELLAVALHVCPDRAAAEDVVQSTFLAAMQKAHHWDAARPLRPWLLGILQREAQREWRRRARRRRDEPEPDRAAPPPEQFVLAAEVRDAVTSAIAATPQPYRDVLELRLLQGLSNAGIAARKQRAPGAVRTQLWRGLELLRGLLPKGIALGLAGQLAPQGGLATLRERVVAAAERAKVVGVAGTLAGVVLMKKALVAAAAAVACASLTWLVWTHVAGEPERASVEPVGSGVVASSGPSEPAPATGGPDARREALAAPATGSAMPQGGAASPAASFEIDVLVVDPQGHAVADAEVLAFEPSWTTRKDGQRTLRERREVLDPFLVRRTDLLGRARLAIPHAACFLLGRKEAVGTTGDTLIRHAPCGPDEQRLVLVLVRPLRVVGVVLDANGGPATGATVQVSGGTSLSAVVAPPAQRTGSDGRFALEVVPGGDYQVIARDGARSTDSVAVDTYADHSDRELVLRFPGAFSVRGVLLDAHGQPLTGRVFVLADSAVRGRRDGDHREAQTKADGRFEILLHEGGRYHVCGGVAGWTPGQASVELGDGQWHAEVVLQVAPFLPVGGHVVDAAGRPCAGVFLGIGLAADRDPLVSQLLELTGVLARGETDTGGAFHFLVPAGLRYRLVVRASPHLFAWKQEFTAPAENLVVTLLEADRQGFVIAGQVVDASSGAPVPQFTVNRVTHASAQSSSSDVVARVRHAGGRFDVGPFPAGARYSLTIEAKGYADTDVGPFDGTVRREDVRVALPRTGRVAVRVLHADGRPAVQVHVGVSNVPHRPFGRAHQGPTDAEGRILLDGVVPGRCRIGSFPPGDPARSVWQEVDVLPGAETEVRLILY